MDLTVTATGNLATSIQPQGDALKNDSAGIAPLELVRAPTVAIRADTHSLGNSAACNPNQ